MTAFGSNAGVVDHRLEAAVHQLINCGYGLRLAKQALRRKQNQRFADRPAVRTAAHLSPQDMEVLRGVVQFADRHVVLGAELQESLDTCAGMLRSLSFIAVRQQQHQTATVVPTWSRQTTGTGR